MYTKPFFTPSRSPQRHRRARRPGGDYADQSPCLASVSPPTTESPYSTHPRLCPRGLVPEVSHSPRRRRQVDQNPYSDWSDQVRQPAPSPPNSLESRAMLSNSISQTGNHEGRPTVPNTHPANGIKSSPTTSRTASVCGLFVSGQVSVRVSCQSQCDDHRSPWPERRHREGEMEWCIALEGQRI